MATAANGLVKDKNQQSIQIGNSYQTNDGTGTPITSPLTVTGSVQTLVVPTGAVELILYPVNNNLKISEGVAVSQYDLVAAGAKESIPVARMSNVYIQGTASDTLYFRFTIV